MALATGHAMISHDAIVIGSGQAGPFLAVRLAQSGLKVALIVRANAQRPPGAEAPT